MNKETHCRCRRLPVRFHL